MSSFIWHQNRITTKSLLSLPFSQTSADVWDFIYPGRCSMKQLCNRSRYLSKSQQSAPGVRQIGENIISPSFYRLPLLHIFCINAAASEAWQQPAEYPRSPRPRPLGCHRGRDKNPPNLLWRGDKGKYGPPIITGVPYEKLRQAPLSHAILLLHHFDQPTMKLPSHLCFQSIHAWLELATSHRNPLSTPTSRSYLAGVPREGVGLGHFHQPPVY